MNIRKIVKISLGIFLLILVILVIIGVKGKKHQGSRTEVRADGIGLIFSSFDEDNKKTLELKCKESKKETADKTAMKNIEGLIYKHGRMNKDVRVYAEKGSVENNLYNFFIEKNARIIAEDLAIVGKNFYLKDRAELTTSTNSTYIIKNLSGIAEAGIGFYLDMNTIKLYNTKGTYTREDRNFDFQTSVLWVMENSQLVVMEKGTVIQDDHSILKSDWFSIQFTKEFKRIKETVSQSNSYVYSENPQQKETREIKGNIIQSLFDEKGKVTQMVVMQNGDILQKTPSNRTIMRSSKIIMNFDGPTGKPKSLQMLLRGTFENTGKDNVRVIADKLGGEYDKEGELQSCEGKGNVQFNIERYRGETEHARFNLKKNSLTLEGENTEVVTKLSSFRSSAFKLDTENRILTSTSGIKSVVRMQQENALFSRDPIFINARKLTMNEKEEKFVYEQEVSLTQKELQLDANSLEIKKEDYINAAGSVAFLFKDRKSKKEISIKGEELSFDARKKTITIRSNAAIKSDENILTASLLVIHFNDNNEIERITGEKTINFVKDNISGYSDKILWLFKEETVTLEESPYIIKSSSDGSGKGKMTGKILKIDLKTNKITIISGESGRTETIIEQ